VLFVNGLQLKCIVLDCVEKSVYLVDTTHAKDPFPCAQS
jgi:hypothetical protein